MRWAGSIINTAVRKLYSHGANPNPNRNTLTPTVTNPNPDPNLRFKEGRPSNDPSEVGVMVRMFDGMDDGVHDRPWLPCPPDGAWCSDHV